jgi:hypothetical protein
MGDWEVEETERRQLAHDIGCNRVGGRYIVYFFPDGSVWLGRSGFGRVGIRSFENKLIIESLRGVRE